ncbi:hypothetical protein [Kibdelosporangium philippinense]|uniref:hypothetical protein n=1 Tax=Kibdelosporangium philippinense TaxID=211113 RepID=UPI003611A8FB
MEGPAKSGLDGERLAEAMWLNEQHWARAGRPVSAETVHKHLRIGAASSRALTRAVREVNRAAVDGSSAAAIEKNQSSAEANGFRLHHVSSAALS